MSCTLAEVEVEIARRCGPFEAHVAASGTTTTAVVTALTSSIDAGDAVDLWLLRRSADVGDRQRRVAAYAPMTGTLTVDRAYATAVAAGEALELLVLDPTQQLRVAALAGLRRCYFVDRVDVTPTGGALEHDLSAALVWVTDVGQVRDVAYRTGAVGVLRPGSLGWHRTFSTSAGVQTAVAARTSGVLVVEALRPHASWVNGADSTTGPTLDTDVLAVDLDYAAAAGHIEAWRRCVATLAPVAREGMAITRQAAKDEFEAQVNRHVPVRPDRLSFRYPLGGRATGLWDAVQDTGTWAHVAQQGTWRALSAISWRQVLGL